MLQHDPGRAVVIARTIAEGKKYIGQNPNVPLNALVIVDARGLQGLRIAELHWAPEWDIRRTPQHRTLIETSARVRLVTSQYADTICSGLIDLKEPVPA